MLGYRSSSKKCGHGAPSGERGMTENGSESLPFEPPEQENIRLRDENARLRRLLSVHSIPIPQLAPENPPPAETVETAAPLDKEERARKRIGYFEASFAEERMSTRGDGRVMMTDTDICQRP